MRGKREGGCEDTDRTLRSLRVTCTQPLLKHIEHHCKYLSLESSFEMLPLYPEAGEVVGEGNYASDQDRGVAGEVRERDQLGEEDEDHIQ